MAEFVSFDEGQDAIMEGGVFLRDVFIDLSTKSVGATNPYVETDTYATRGTPAPGTGYSRGTYSGPANFTNGTCVFAQKSWATSTATDWSAVMRSAVMTNGTVAICAFNLQTGGGARDMSGAQTTEQFTPTLVLATG
jgi:hypothetical protein